MPHAPPQPTPTKTLDIRPLADIPRERVRWLWPGRIPLNKLTILAGAPDAGKTFISIDVAACVSTGAEWPDGTGTAPLGSALILSSEDGPGDTIRPRLEAAGGDMQRVHFVGGLRSAQGTEPLDLPTHLVYLSREIRRIGDVVLVVIDPITGFLNHKLDTNRSNETRHALQHLGRFAEENNVAILGVCHIRKSAAASAGHRLLGSQEFGAVCRSILMVSTDPRDESGDSRLLLHEKSNLAKRPHALRFKIGEDSVVHWLGIDTSIRASDVFCEQPRGKREPGPRVKEAIAFLRDALADGERPLADIQAEAQAKSISMGSLRRAKERLGVISTNNGTIGEPYVLRLAQEATA